MRRLALVLTLFMSACANHTHEIPATYVSPMEYQDYTCKQIGAELGRVSRRVQEVAHEVNKNADGDSAAMAAGLILFWPALFFIDGDSPQAQEYGRLKGQYDALEQVSVKKNCGIQFGESPFAKIEAEQKQKTATQQSASNN